MCGIAGYVVTDRKLYQQNVRRVLANFAVSWTKAEDQGRDAAGIAIVKPTSTSEIRKTTGRVWNLIGNLRWEGLSSALGVIGHARAATSGSPKDQVNNHPIICDSVFGVHNGILYGNDELEKTYGCKYEVDSELLFRIMDTFKYDISALRFIGKEVNGSIAMAWHRVSTPYIGLYSNGGNPLGIRFSDHGVAYFATRVEWIPEMNGPKLELGPGEAVLLSPEGILSYELPVQVREYSYYSPNQMGGAWGNQPSYTRGGANWDGWEGMEKDVVDYEEIEGRIRSKGTTMYNGKIQQLRTRISG